MPSVNKTPNLELNQWLGNEYVKRTDFNEDNKKIDEAYEKLKKEIESKATDAAGTSYDNTNSKLTSTNVQGAIDELNTKTNENKTSILNLKAKVDNGQNHKLTSDDGKCIQKGNINANDLILNGDYDGNNILNMPNGSKDWWYIEVKAHSNGNYVYQEATELNKDPARKYYRTMQGGSWKLWRSL